MMTQSEKLIDAALLVLDWMLEHPDPRVGLNRGAMQDGLNAIVSSARDEQDAADLEPATA